LSAREAPAPMRVFPTTPALRVGQRGQASCHLIEGDPLDSAITSRRVPLMADPDGAGQIITNVGEQAEDIAGRRCRIADAAQSTAVIERAESHPTGSHSPGGMQGSAHRPITCRASQPRHRR
jgi:hypothetical protein